MECHWKLRRNETKSRFYSRDFIYKYLKKEKKNEATVRMCVHVLLQRSEMNSESQKEYD